MRRQYKKKHVPRGRKSDLKFNRAYRCDCGVIYIKKPTQCRDKNCGSIKFTKFDSYGEACRYASLLLLESVGKISDLRRQTRIKLHTVNQDGMKVKVGEYWPDFEYIQDGERVVEDFKSIMLDLAAWKLRHVKAEYGIDVKLTTE